MTLHDILLGKGNAVQTIHPEATLAEVVKKLVDCNIGSLVVCSADAAAESRQPVGIITERDILHACASEGASLAGTVVGDAMTAQPICGTPADTIDHTLGLMTERRMRHLPVLQDGLLVGIVSIGDLVKAQHDRLAMENQFMREYIQG